MSKTNQTPTSYEAKVKIALDVMRNRNKLANDIEDFMGHKHLGGLISVAELLISLRSGTVFSMIDE